MTDLQNVNFFGVRSLMLNPQHCDCSPDECVQQALVMRPSARLVSKEFSTNDDDATDPRLTHMVPLFGQFLDHDLSMTPEEESCPCCENGSPNDDNCMPIDIPLEDQLSKGVPCLPFSRSVVFCKDNPGNLGKPEQMNAITGNEPMTTHQTLLLNMNASHIHLIHSHSVNIFLIWHIHIQCLNVTMQPIIKIMNVSSLLTFRVTFNIQYPLATSRVKFF